MVLVRYRECLKNHAASIGGNAIDGCGEFMPSGEDGTLEALTCSACNCHRNFHRKEINIEDQLIYYDYNNYHSAPPHLNRSMGRKVILQGHGRLAGTESLIRPPPKMIMSYNMGIGSLLPSESDHEQEDGGGFMISSTRHEHVQPHPIMVMKKKKRFRTKFTQEQKEKMFGFAEKVGWKIQKVDESVVQQVCQELGIKRRVLKVWMHNNKHTLPNKIIPTHPQNQMNI